MGTKNSSSRRVPRRPLFFHLKGCTWNGEQFSLGANNRVEKAGKRNRGGREKGIFESIPARVFGGYNNTRGGGGGREACFKYLCVIKWTSERKRERGGSLISAIRRGKGNAPSSLQEKYYSLRYCTRANKGLVIIRIFFFRRRRNNK